MSWDGKIYDKYKIEHTDGTPLKGKKHFVLRLDSDDHAEAARVAAAMRAYKSKPRNFDVGTPSEQAARFHEFCQEHRSQIEGMCSQTCPLIRNPDTCNCLCAWGQMPYKKEQAK